MAESFEQIRDTFLTESTCNAETSASINILRQILSAEQNRDVTYEEATDIGQSLVDFFQILAETS